MARAWRIEYEGALYHVLSGGNERQNIVTNDDDRKLCLATAGEMAERLENRPGFANLYRLAVRRGNQYGNLPK